MISNDILLCRLSVIVTTNNDLILNRENIIIFKCR